MNTSSDYASTVVKGFYAVPFSTSFPESSPTRPPLIGYWERGWGELIKYCIVPFWSVNRLFSFILSQVITLKHWMMQKLQWAYDHLS